MVSLSHWPLGILSYAVCHLIHIAVWRGWSPRRDIMLIFTLMACLPGLIYLGLVVVDTDWLAPAAVHLILAGNYIAIYPAFQASSPTIRILSLLARKPGTTTQTEIVAWAGAQNLLQDRLTDLRNSNLVRQEAEGLGLTRSGSLLAAIFLNYRRGLGLPGGEG